MAARMAMMAITTSSSIKVKARTGARFLGQDIGWTPREQQYFYIKQRSEFTPWPDFSMLSQH